MNDQTEVNDKDHAEGQSLLNDRLGWVSTETKPQTHKPVAVFVSGEKYKYWARAMWVPKFTLEDTGSYEGASDYNDADDNYYWPEGWYEWNHAEEIHWLFSDEVTHWAEMVLPNY